MKLKSVTRRYILAIIALLAGPNLRGETVLVTQFSSSSCNALHILTVYQLEGEIIVTKHLEKRNGLCVIGGAMLQATFEMNFPSIALREVDSFNNLISFGNTLLTIGKWQVLYQNGVVENSYNPDWSDPWNGNGWVDTRAAGYVNIKQYPWIYHPELGWLKVTEGGHRGRHHNFGFSR